jgi:hypothetical protein
MKAVQDSQAIEPDKEEEYIRELLQEMVLIVDGCGEVLHLN